MEVVSTKMIWIPDKNDVWLSSEVFQFDEAKQTYICEANEVKSTFQKSITHPVDPSHLLDLDNLCFMNNMHEAPLLDLLRRRFRCDKIYTYTGDVLISLNPYKTIPHLYDNPLSHLNLTEEKDKIMQLNESSENISPHVFKIANNALKNMIQNRTAIMTATMPSRSVMFEDSTATTDTDSQAINKNQSIIISGESGAGKTEASKVVMNFLIQANKVIRHHACHHSSTDNLSQSSQNRRYSSINEADINAVQTEHDDLFASTITAVLLDSSIIFESFGNAKTVRNDNSSRFGKYIKLLYNNHDNQLVSAITETFLLEKSRLVSVGQNERNYHIFYQLINTLPSENSELNKKLNLVWGVEDYRILIDGNCSTVNGVDDVHEFKSTQKALQTLKCSLQEIEEIYTLLACILHLGNMQTISGSDVQSISTGTESRRGSTVDSADGDGTAVKVESTSIELAKLAELMGLFPEQLTMCLTSVQIMIAKRASINTKMLSPTEVKQNIHALIKFIYNKLFAWLVRKINFAQSFLGTNGTDKRESTNDTDSPNAFSFIGILDIFGFEILTSNSFEQLCINFTNERLQQQFNEHVFVTEQEIYRTEGLNWSSITFQDNQHVIDMISRKPTGLLFILEEHGMMNRKPDDVALLTGFNAIHDKSNIPNNAYAKSRFGNTLFIVKHFAGEVSYLIDGFLSKNNDSLQDDLLGLLASSNNVFIRNALGIGEQDSDGPGHIPAYTNSAANSTSSESSRPVSMSVAAKNRQSKKMASTITVSQQFRAQLDVLMSTLRNTTPHYIKCIKPNSVKQRDNFESLIVMEQLRYSGVLEVVRIRREGFPIRMQFIEFYTNYDILASGKRGVWKPAAQCNDEEARPYAIQLLQDNLHDDLFQIGHSQIFLRDGCFAALQLAIKNHFGRNATVIQSKYRTVLAVRRYHFTLFLITVLQAQVRKFTQQSKLRKVLQAVRKIQWFLAGKKQRKLWQLQYAALLKRKAYDALRLKQAVKIQSIVRVFIAKLYAKKLYELLLKVQLFCSKNYYMHKYYARYHLKRACAICLQSLVRCHQKRKRYMNLRKQAIKIQSLCRTICTVKLAHSRRKAIRKMQSVMRMRGCVNKYALVRCAVYCLQNYVRTKIQRRVYLHTVKYIVRIQSQLRKLRDRNRFHSAVSAIIAIQTTFRMFKAKRYYYTCIGCCVALQSTFRRKIAQNKRKFQLFTVIYLQSLVRRYQAKRMLQTLKHAQTELNGIIKIQTIYRGHIARKQAILMFCAVICIQAIARMYIAKRQYDSYIVNILILQTQVRRYCAMKDYQRQLVRIVRIQSKIRTFIAKLRKRREMRAIVRVQSLGRMIIEKQRFDSAFVSIVTLQTVIRKALAKLRFRVIRAKIIKIQAIMRSKLKQMWYAYMRYAIIKIQANVRCYQAYAQYMKVFCATICLQTLARRVRAQNNYKQSRLMIIKIQAQFRRALCRIDYMTKYCSILAIQSIARMYIAKNAYFLALISIIIVQTSARRVIHTMRYQKQRTAIITIQSLFRATHARILVHTQLFCVLMLQTNMRMSLERKRYNFKRFLIIQIQSNIRMALAYKKYQRTYASVLLTQSLFRMYPCKKLLRNVKHRVTLVAKIWRCKSDASKYIQNRQRIERLQVCIRRFLLNSRLRNTVLSLHAELRKQTSADQTVMNTLFNSIKESALIRNKWSDYCSVLHSAICSADLQTVKLLNVNYKDVFDTDIKHRNSAHYGTMNPSMQMMYWLAAVVNKYRYVSKVSVQGFDEDDDEDDSNTFGVKSPDSKKGGDHSTSMFALKEALTKSSTGNSVLKDGWMKKKRGGMMWQRRWFVLTEDYIIYYKDNKSLNNPKFAIPLLGCSIQRLAGRDPILELTQPQMVEKKSFFGSSSKKSINYLCESELDLQEWLMPLKAVAGVSTLRTTPVNYIQCELRQLWLNNTDNDGENALHSLIRSAEKLSSAPEKLRECVKLCAWLCESGCNVNARNKDGNTVLHLAILCNIQSSELLNCLLLKSADLTVKNNDGLNVQQLATNASSSSSFYLDLFKKHSTRTMSSMTSEKTMQRQGSMANIVKVSTLANKLKGYSYLSIYFGAQSSAIYSNSAMSVSLYNSKQQLIEESRDITSPILSSPSDVTRGIYWGHSWHMQTPLENLEQGTTLLLEYCDADKDGAESTPAVVHFIAYPIDAQSIDSTMNSAAWRVSTQDIAPNMNKAQRVSMLLSQVGLSVSSKGVETKLDVDISIHQRSRAVDVKSIMLN